MTNSLIEHIPEQDPTIPVYLHKCFLCDKGFTDLTKPYFVWLGRTSWEIGVFNSNFYFNSMCKSCLHHVVNFLTEKLKTVSLPFESEQLCLEQ